MPNPIKIKRSSTPGAVPATLADGELAINTADRLLFFKDSAGTIRSKRLWQDIPAGGTAGQVLKKLSATDFDVAWANDEGALSRASALVIETDFYNTGTPFAQGLVGTAVSSGTVVNIAGTPDHPGIVALRDSTTANGGYRVQTDAAAIRIAGGERLVCVFQVRNVRAGIRAFIGFFDNTTNVDPTDCACFIITSNGTTASIAGRTRANNTATNTAAINLVINTWYTAIIEVNSAATSCNFALFAENGTLIGQEALGNLPTAAGRETGLGVAAYESSTDAAADILYADYLRAEINRTLTR